MLSDRKEFERNLSVLDEQRLKHFDKNMIHRFITTPHDGYKSGFQTLYAKDVIFSGLNTSLKKNKQNLFKCRMF